VTLCQKSHISSRESAAVYEILPFDKKYNLIADIELAVVVMISIPICSPRT
jgi:hypothetical protein